MNFFCYFVMIFAIFKIANAKYVGSDKMKDNMIIDESDEVSEKIYGMSQMTFSNKTEDSSVKVAR